MYLRMQKLRPETTEIKYHGLRNEGFPEGIIGEGMFHVIVENETSLDLQQDYEQLVSTI